ncbi:HypC/HybG/HupF family hydrogenase formation chaperone [Candidatus Fermentibacteria bacterium]|nr:HypC/HybG/HupF family hydrogenase formation chaperone [Candidatus Fermentibacteria bacterium]
MCLAIPMKIVKIEGDQARAELKGAVRRVRLDLVEGAEVGNYVLVHAGFAISLLEEEDALQTLEYLAEVERLGRS